jgi:hypothetical protein
MPGAGEIYERADDRIRDAIMTTPAAIAASNTRDAAAGDLKRCHFIAA